MSPLNWAIPQTRSVLMIPGPTEIPHPVLQAMNQPPSIQYDQRFDEGVLEPTTLALRDLGARGEPGAGVAAAQAVFANAA